MLTTQYPQGVTMVLLCTLLLSQSCQSQLNMVVEEIPHQKVPQEGTSDALAAGPLTSFATHQQVAEETPSAVSGAIYHSQETSTDLGCRLRQHYLQDSFTLLESSFPGGVPKHVKDFSFTLRLVSQDQGFGAESQVQKEHIGIDALFTDRNIQLDMEPYTIQRVLVVGDPGTGKTTLSKQLAYRWSRGEWGDQFKLVYVLPVRNLYSSGYDDSSYRKEPTLATSIVNNCLIAPQEETSYQALRQQVGATLSHPSTLIILDGLDERFGNHVAVCEALIEQAKLGSHALLMLSHAYNAKQEIAQADVSVVLSGLSSAQVRTYIDANLDASQSKSLPSFFRQHAPSAIVDIAHVPVNLEMLCFLWKHPSAQSSIVQAVKADQGSLSGLYRALTAQIWKRYADRSEVLRSSEEVREGLFDILGRLAFISWKGEARQTFISKSHVEALMEELTLKYPDALHIRMQNVEFLLLQYLEDIGQYKFPHLAFQEYFASRWLAKQFFSDDVKIREEATGFFQAHKYVSRYENMFTFLAGEASSHASKQQRCEVIDMLLTLANAGVAEADKKEIAHLQLQMHLANAWLRVSEVSEIEESWYKLEQSFGTCALLEAKFKEGIRLMQEEDGRNAHIPHLTRLLEDCRLVAKQAAPRCLAMLLDGSHLVSDSAWQAQYARRVCVSSLVRVAPLARVACLARLQAATTHIDAGVQEAARYAISQLTGPLVSFASFGAAEWEKYFGVKVGEVPALPAGLEAILDSPCPFWVDRTVRDTHLLFLMPTAVDGVPFTLNKLGELIKTRFLDNEVGYHFYWNKVQDRFGDQLPSGAPYWVLMTRDILPDSCGVSHGFPQAEVANNYVSEGYRFSQALEAATGILTHYVRTGERLFPDPPDVFIRCEELVDSRWPVYVGGFSSAGLAVSYPVDSSRSHVGVACCREF